MQYYKIGIDFGGEYLRIFSYKTLIFKEHSLIAVKKDKENYITVAVGDDALQQGNDENILLFSPIIEGQIQSIEYASLLLKYALSKVIPTYSKSKLFAVISVPSSISLEQKKMYLELCKMSGINSVDIVSAPICSLLGTKEFLPEDEVLIADLGATKCDFQIMKDYKIQKNATLGLGGNSIKSAINQMLIRDKDFLINDEDTIKIEKELASLLEDENKFFAVDGINTKDHINGQLALTSQDIYPITASFFEEISIIINTLLQEYAENSETNPSILISGGLGKTNGLLQFLTQKFPNTKIIIETDADSVLTNGFQKLLY